MTVTNPHEGKPARLEAFKEVHAMLLREDRSTALALLQGLIDSAEGATGSGDDK